MNFLKKLKELRSLAPYAVIELLLPGGSLIAIALWFIRRRMAGTPPASAAHV